MEKNAVKSHLMLHALNPIEKAICKKIILTSFLLFIFLVLPLFCFYETLLKLGAPARFLIMAAAFAFFLLILSVRIKKIVSRHISKPLDELSKFTDEVASGNYYAHASVFSDTEVGSLARNLNFMVEMTSKHTSALEESINSKTAEVEKLKIKADSLAQQLTEALKCRRDMDSIFSIDMKSPVCAMINYFEVLCFSDEFFKEKCHARLNSLSASVKNAYLDFFSAAGIADGEKLSVSCAKTSFEALIDSALERYAPSAEIKNITVKKDIGEDLAFASIDKIKISSVVDNLISNAVKFSPSGKQITIRSHFEGESLYFAISDKGKGISEDIQEKIFLSDFCVTTPGTFGESGFGTGLKLCKAFIEAHGGTFWFESSPDAGSVFYFKIPMGKINI